jgi:DNA-binding XRE family transcriptional regulator
MPRLRKASRTHPTLKERIAAVKNERDIAQVAFDRALAETRPEARITQEKIAKFVDVMRTNVLTGETPFRRAYIRSVVDQVEVTMRKSGFSAGVTSWSASSWAAARLPLECPVLFGSGAPEEIRTPDPPDS